MLPFLLHLTLSTHIVQGLDGAVVVAEIQIAPASVHSEITEQVDSTIIDWFSRGVSMMFKKC